MNYMRQTKKELIRRIENQSATIVKLNAECDRLFNSNNKLDDDKRNLITHINREVAEVQRLRDAAKTTRRYIELTDEESLRYTIP